MELKEILVEQYFTRVARPYQGAGLDSSGNPRRYCTGERGELKSSPLPKDEELIAAAQAAIEKVAVEYRGEAAIAPATRDGAMVVLRWAQYYVVGVLSWEDLLGYSPELSERRIERTPQELENYIRLTAKVDPSRISWESWQRILRG